MFPERLEKELHGLLPPSISNGIRVISPSYGADSAWIGAKLIGNVSYFITNYLDHAKLDIFTTVMFSFCTSWSDHSWFLHNYWALRLLSILTFIHDHDNLFTFSRLWCCLMTWSLKHLGLGHIPRHFPMWRPYLTFLSIQLSTFPGSWCVTKKQFRRKSRFTLAW